MALSSDEIIKRQIIDEIGYQIGDLTLRIFPESSSDDQILFEEGGLTFSHNNVHYGSCDAAWYFNANCPSGKRIKVPVVALEGTDALQRGSSGNAQYQRFHHALGPVKNGLIGVYYLRPGKDKIQEDLYGMAYFASQYEAGTYLVFQDLDKLRILLDTISRFGVQSSEVNVLLQAELQSMYKEFDEKFKKYNRNWITFAEKRSTILMNDKVIKYAGRMRRNFTDPSQRAGHIAVGEMYLTKYYFYQKPFYYLFAKMTHEDLKYLDRHKGTDKEWYLLRNEPNVYIKTMDDIIGLPSHIIKSLLSIQDEPLKGEALRVYTNCMKEIVVLLRSGQIHIA